MTQHAGPLVRDIKWSDEGADGEAKVLEETAEMKHARVWYRTITGEHPEGAGLLKLWEQLADNERYLQYRRNLHILNSGLDPMPDTDEATQIVRYAGHTLIAKEVLPVSSFLRRLFWGGYICWEHYAALQMTVVACLMREAALLTLGEFALAYSAVDQLLHGGRDWPSVASVPAATRELYQTLRRVRLPNMVNVIAPLDNLLEGLVEQRSGEPSDPNEQITRSALQMLVAAVAHRNGHQVVTLDDMIEACYAYLELFDIDLHDLRMVERHGRTGYEEVG